MLIGGYPGQSCVVVLKWISGSSERKKIYEPESEAAPPERAPLRGRRVSEN